MFLPAIFSTSTIALQPQRIAYIGDSYTLGVGDEDGEGYAGKVSRMKGYDEYRIVGYTFEESMSRMDELDAFQPDIIIIELGIHFDGRDSIQTYEEFRIAVEDIIDVSVEKGKRIFYMEIPWRVWGDSPNAQAQHLNDIIREVASQKGIRTISSFSELEACGWVCIGEDNSHPNGKGYRIIANDVIWVLDGKSEYTYENK